MPLTRTIIGVALASLLVAGCGGEGPSEDAQQESPDTQKEGAEELAHVTEKFTGYSEDAPAVTYDENLVPIDSTVEVSVTKDDAQESEYDLAVKGLKPEREYGAHMHTQPCGPDPKDSGPHYQHKKAPKDQKNDPKFANDDNEVWLDFTTDTGGNAESDTDVDWLPRKGEMNSLVIHDHHTSTGKGTAGDAGDRLACVNVPI